MKVHSHSKTVLNSRTLWFDGDSAFNATDVSNGLHAGARYVDSLTPEIIRYNSLVSSSEQIKVKAVNDDLSFEWNIPDDHKSINIIEYVANKLEAVDGSKEDILLREERCADELIIYKKLGLFETLKALIYIINILVEKKIVWGVGRGSSVSSYVLYVIGVHDVDSYHYDLDIAEFLRST